MSNLIPVCPRCGNVVQSNRIIQNHRTGATRGHCLRCKKWISFQLPAVRKKLVYLDQSFLSDLHPGAENLGSDHPTKQSLFAKLKKLKEMNRVFLVISDIHSRETSAIDSEQYAEKRRALWQFQNDLADGQIASDWNDTFVAQHRRMLSDEGSDLYPVSDIGLVNPHQARVGVKVVLTNSWRLKLHSDYGQPRDASNSEFRKILERQVDNIPCCLEVSDCLNYIGGLWRKEIQDGITAYQQRMDFLSSFEKLGELPDALQLATLQVPPPVRIPLLQVVCDVIRGLDEAVGLQRWSELLKIDPIGVCPSVRIRVALEAELLWTRYQGKRLNPNPRSFNENFGLSRQNDINHVSAFVPYVDALTTDKDMHNLCGRKVAAAELKRFSCKIFSAKNYDAFEQWLDELLAEPTNAEL